MSQAQNAYGLFDRENGALSAVLAVLTGKKAKVVASLAGGLLV